MDIMAEVKNRARIENIIARELTYSKVEQIIEVLKYNEKTRHEFTHICGVSLLDICLVLEFLIEERRSSEEWITL